LGCSVCFLIDKAPIWHLGSKEVRWIRRQGIYLGRLQMEKPLPGQKKISELMRWGKEVLEWEVQSLSDAGRHKTKCLIACVVVVLG